MSCGKIDDMAPVVGTVLKINVTAVLSGGLHLEDVDFECEFYSETIGTKKVTVKKAQMAYVDVNNYLAVVDTKEIGTGWYWCLLTVMIPDNDVESGYREEMIRIPTNIPVRP